jgi:hypothetical protein
MKVENRCGGKRKIDAVINGKRKIDAAINGNRCGVMIIGNVCKCKYNKNIL